MFFNSRVQSSFITERLRLFGTSMESDIRDWQRDEEAGK